jgi:flagellar biosynthesis protein FliQ
MKSNAAFSLHLSDEETSDYPAAQSRARSSRVRGYHVTIDLTPSRQPSPRGRGRAFASVLHLLHSFRKFRKEIVMTGAETLDVAREAIWTIVIVSGPLLAVGLVVGVAISLVQALTQIQEQTLVFVPKILAIFVTLVLALPFMADALHAEMMRISSRIIGG